MDAEIWYETAGKHQDKVIPKMKSDDQKKREKKHITAALAAFNSIEKLQELQRLAMHCDLEQLQLLNQLSLYGMRTEHAFARVSANPCRLEVTFKSDEMKFRI